MENPAIRLRDAIEPLCAGCMLKWDASRLGVLVTDAPRRGMEQTALSYAQENGLPIMLGKGLLHIDLSHSTYNSLLSTTFCHPGTWNEEWLHEQAFLSSVLSRTLPDAPELPATDLFRQTIIACVQNPAVLRAQIQALHQADADALRTRTALHSLRACASLCAYRLWTEWQIGLPPTASASFNLYA